MIAILLYLVAILLTPGGYLIHDHDPETGETIAWAIPCPAGETPPCEGWVHVDPDGAISFWTDPEAPRDFEPSPTPTWEVRTHGPVDPCANIEDIAEDDEEAARDLAERYGCDIDDEWE